MTSNKIILTITQLSNGGAERVVSVWASELAEHGNEVYVLLSGKLPDEYPLSEKVHKMYIASVYGGTEDYKTYKKLSRVKQFLGRRKLIKQINPDYIISFLSHIQIWTLLTTVGLKIKKIETIRSNPWVASSMMGKFSKFLWMLCFNRGYKIIVQNSEQADFFKNNNRKKCVIIPNTISDVFIENYKKDFSDKALNFVACGRIVPVKNYPLLINAFALSYEKNSNISLSIYGYDEDNLKNELQKLVDEKDLGMAIHLKGNSNNIIEAYKNSDVFILSSDNEGMPNVLMEAMATKLTCISTSCRTGPKDLIDDGENGFLVPVGDAKAMADKILYVSRMSREERMAMGEKAREKVLHLCSKENTIEKLNSILC